MRIPQTHHSSLSSQLLDKLYMTPVTQHYTKVYDETYYPMNMIVDLERSQFSVTFLFNLLFPLFKKSASWINFCLFRYMVVCLRSLQVLWCIIGSDAVQFKVTIYNELGIADMYLLTYLLYINAMFQNNVSFFLKLDCQGQLYPHPRKL